MTAAKFRKRPVVIEAVQWKVANHEEIKKFLGADYLAVLSKYTNKPAHLSIRTLEGQLYAAPGDWIIRGLHGEHYPCKPDIFEATYEPTDVERPLIVNSCPECNQGKHINCTDSVLGSDDEFYPCPCHCPDGDA